MRHTPQPTLATNNGKRLTIPIKTRTPQEAFAMFRAGQPVDNMAGYYSTQGEDTTDFHLLDKIGKLHKLNDFREARALADQEINSLTNTLKHEKAEADRVSRDNREISQRSGDQINRNQQDEPGQLLRETGITDHQTKVPQIQRSNGDPQRDLRTP